MVSGRTILRGLLIALAAVAVAVAIPTLSAPTPEPKPKPIPMGDCSGEEDRYACCAYQQAQCMDMCDREGEGPACYEECERAFVRCLHSG